MACDKNMSLEKNIELKEDDACELAMLDNSGTSGLCPFSQNDAVARNIPAQGRGNIDRIVEKKEKNGHFFYAAVTIFNKPVTDKYKHFVAILKHQRCMFLVPILRMVDEPGFNF